MSPFAYAKDLVKTGIKDDDTKANLGLSPISIELPAKDKDVKMAWVKFFNEMAAEESVDYMAIESILKEPKFDSKSASTLLPYSALYKFG